MAAKLSFIFFPKIKWTGFGTFGNPFLGKTTEFLSEFFVLLNRGYWKIYYKKKSIEMIIRKINDTHFSFICVYIYIIITPTLRAFFMLYRMSLSKKLYSKRSCTLLINLKHMLLHLLAIKST